MSEIQQLAKKYGLPNWELIVFALIFRVTRGKGPRFYRTELFSTKNIDIAVDWSRKLGHKKDPQHPEETMQRTLQNMRDKKYILFHGQGSYELTTIGSLVLDRFEEHLIALVDQNLEPQTLVVK